MTPFSRRKFMEMSAVGVAAAALDGLTRNTAHASTRRGFMTGMLARRPQDLNDFTAPYVTGLVVELRWNVAQTSLGGSITQQARDILSAGINLANRYNKNRLKLRVLTGIHSPSFAMSAGGTPISNWVDGQSRITYAQVPRWWRNEYMNAYDSFIEKLAPLLSDPRWLEVTISGPMTVFAEPCIHQYGVLTNRDKIKAILEGSSPRQTPADLDKANLGAVERSIAIHQKYFQSMGIVGSLAYNPWEWLDASYRYQVDVNRTIGLMARQKSILGNIGVWQNNSLQAREVNRTIVQTREADGYPEMYAQMRNLSWYSQYQTATVDRIHEADGTVYDTVRYVVQNYGLSVEMPSGWWQTQWDDSEYRGLRLKNEANDLNAAMAANVARVKP